MQRISCKSAYKYIISQFSGNCKYFLLPMHVFLTSPRVTILYNHSYKPLTMHILAVKAISTAP